MRVILLLLAVLSYFWIAAIGTGSDIAMQWPGILGLAVVGVLSVFARRKGWLSGASLACTLCVLILTAYLGMRALASEVPYLARQDVLLVLPCLLCYGLFSIVFRSTGLRLGFIAALAILGIGNTVVGYYQWSTDPTFSVIPGYSRVSHGRLPGGFFNNHSHFSGFLVVPMLLSVTLGLFGRLAASTRVLCAFIWLVCAAGIALSMSRGGLIAAFAGMLAVAAMAILLARRTRFADQRRPLVAGLLLAAVMVGFLGIGGVMIGKRFGGNVLDKEGKIANRGRLAYWQAAIDQIKGAPLFGEGSRSFSYHFYKNFPKKFWVGTPDPVFVHNEFLQLTADYGLIGLVLMLALLAVHVVSNLKYILKRHRKLFEENGSAPSNSLAISIGALCVIVAHVVHGIFDFNMHLLPNALAVSACLGMMAFPGSQHRKSAPGQFAGIAMRGVTVISALVVIAIAWRFAREDDIVRRADNAMRLGDTASAIALLHPLEESGTDNYRVFKLLALNRYNEYYASEMPEVILASYLSKALAGFDRVLELYPNDFWSAVYSARCELLLSVIDSDAEIRRAGYSRVEAHLRHALRWAPLRYEPHTWLAELRRYQAIESEFTGDLPKALVLAEESLEGYSFAVSRTPMRLRREKAGRMPQLQGLREMRKKVAELKVAIRKSQSKP